MKQGKAATVHDSSGKFHTEKREILNRWTENRTELYNHKAEDDRPILRKEVEAAVQSLKKGKSTFKQNWFKQVDRMWSALSQQSAMKIWQTAEWLTPWAQSLVITLLKKGNL